MKSPRQRSPRRKNKRNGPPKSATLYAVGTIRIGADRRNWQVKKDARGAKRWMKI